MSAVIEQNDNLLFTLFILLEISSICVTVKIVASVKYINNTVC